MSSITEKVTNLINYYKNLLIAQYYNKTKAINTIQEITNELFGDGLCFSLERAFDVETAAGPALNYIGKYIGVPRIVYGFVFDRIYFEFADYSIADVTDFIGFRTYTSNPELGAYFKTYNSDLNVSYELTDEELRFLIQLKIQVNNTRSTYSEIKRLVYEVIPNYFLVFDNKDMSITFFSVLNVSRLALLALSLNFLPIPACVQVRYFQVEYVAKIFGFVTYDNQNTDSRGFSEYGTIKEGTFLSYSNSVSL